MRWHNSYTTEQICHQQKKTVLYGVVGHKKKKLATQKKLNEKKSNSVCVGFRFYKLLIIVAVDI
jgi:hypothetical protein